MRLRGKRSAIKEFLVNELETTYYLSALDVKTKPVIVEDDGYEITIKGQAEEGAFWPAIYIKGTQRNFIRSMDFYVYLDEGDDEIQTVCIDDVEAAWGFLVEPYLEKSKKYGIDIRIVGFERGMQFQQEIEIVNGELFDNNEITYDDWLWECPMPNMGG
jgi:hypothetical protein